jgi:hypothetical protein
MLACKSPLRDPPCLLCWHPNACKGSRLTSLAPIACTHRRVGGQHQPPAAFAHRACRRQFTLGQLARMRAMVQQYRPELYRAAARGYRHTPLAISQAFQSGLPPLAVTQAQQAASAAAAASATSRVAGAAAAGPAGGYDASQGLPGSSGSGSRSSSSSSSSSSGGYGNSGGAGTGGSSRAGGARPDSLQQVPAFWDSSPQAMLAASGQLSTEAHQCSCMGADASGRVLWLAELDGGAFWVDAFRLLRRPAPGVVEGDAGSGSGSSNGGDSGTAPGTGSSSGDGGGLLGRQELPAALVELRVGFSAEPGMNAR